MRINFRHFRGKQAGLVLGFLFGLVSLVVGVSIVAANVPVSAAPRLFFGGTETPTTCATGWTIVTTTDLDPTKNELNAVDALSTDDVWAVGTAGDGTHTMIMHWDGTTWGVTYDQILPAGTILDGVSAISTNDVWAVGYYFADGAGGTNGRTITLHYNGQAWSIVPSPNPGLTSTGSKLYAVDGTSANDVWAVGEYYDSVSHLAYYVLMHWDGTQWNLLSGNRGVLYDVVARVGNDVWTVGGDTQSAIGSIILHWDGLQWTSSPHSVSTGGDELLSVTAIAANDVWAIGNTHYQTTEVLALHWNGYLWSRAAVPDSAIWLPSLAALSPGDVWTFDSAPRFPSYPPRSAHWDGDTWTLGSIPVPDPARTSLRDLTAVAGNELWAVGAVLDQQSGHTHTVIEHYVRNCSSATPTPTVCAPGWHTSYSLNPRLYANVLQDVNALSDTDVWSVGGYRVITETIWSPLIEHWNGTTWNMISTTGLPRVMLNSLVSFGPNNIWAVGGTNTVLHWDGTVWNLMPGPNNNFDGLMGIGGTGNNDLWVVGGVDAGSTNTLIFHWDGSQWTQFDLGLTGVLRAVSVISTNDVWAVGKLGGGYKLIIHWDGSAWTQVAAPDPQSGDFYDIDALSANDIWAVGTQVSGPVLAYTAHWDGTQWTSVTAPSSPQVALIGVTAIAADNVWAVGGTGSQCITMHWDGATWQIVPNPDTDWTELLHKVDGLPNGKVWAVGVQWASGAYLTLTQHYDSCSVSTPTPIPTSTSTSTPSFTSTHTTTSTPTNTNTSVPATNTTTNTSTPTRTGTAINTSTLVPSSTWTNTRTSTPANTSTNTPMPPLASPTRTSSPIPTHTAAISPTATQGSVASSTPTEPSAASFTATTTPTATRTSTPISTDTAAPAISPTATQPTVASFTSTQLAASSTPTSTSTACAIRFADVPEEHTFYPYVLCLACRGILAGYACGGPTEPCNANNDPYFRPNNGVTRGQLAKIVSESAGFADTVSGQSFQDVAPGSTFYDYVQRLTGRGVMQGYPCGGPGEPCGPDTRPYFRPNAGATRGQLSKIVSNTLQWSDSIAPGRQTFSDVPDGNSFHIYIERLLMHRPGAMQGYPCGGPGEPCDAQSRPYFRPGNTLTRGQTAKIIANTFFPSCAP